MKRINFHNKGFVLVSVLWITAMLTAITLGFGRRAVLERRAAAYALDQEEALMMARAAVDRGIVEMHNRGLMFMLLPRELQGGTHLAESWAQPKDLFDEGYFENAQEYENDEVIYVITDEERYININTAPIEILEEIESMSRTIVRRVKARREKEVHEKEGVTPFQSIEEIRYLRGVSEKDWFGDRDKPALKNILTVWGDGKININTASAQVLHCIPKVRKRDVDTILAYRNGSDGVPYTSDDLGFKNMQDLEEKTGVTVDPSGPLNTYCTCISTYFRITGVATRRHGRIRAVCSAVIGLDEGVSNILDWQEKTLGS
ncbi:MAG: hypothetical protein GX117_13530 [Candidatus Hydrogenedentes bacterium]|nr:hypothetical protein [Candidatus Hydrogenedentota bacterium]